MPKEVKVRSPATYLPPTKPVKTERTHEENQERAYVAASRRSDRSIEARVESAHRASEIHKKRTGRGFKITQQGVQNEEMYEEEDDLPLQYRNVAAHLRTPNGAFNERLSNYLQSNLVMRQMVAAQMELSEQNTSGHPNYNQFPNMLPMQMQMQQTQQQPQHGNVLRQAPYTMPRPPVPQQNFQPAMSHQRSASFQATEVPYSPSVPTMDHRRMSMPAAVPSAAGSPMQMHTPISNDSVHSTPAQRPATFSRQSSGIGQPGLPSQVPYNMDSLYTNYSPFTPQLPSNAQGFLGSTLDSNTAFSPLLMAGSGDLVSSFYNFDTQPQSQSQTTFTNTVGQQTHPTLKGLSSTLAQSALDTQLDADQSQPQNFFNEAFTGIKTEDGTPAGTPGDNTEWDNFMNNDFFDIPSSHKSQ